tara:strand:- start:9627 stop:10457 length:831 start_codon:yes stop_codon:yes gene_type:complete
MKDAYYFSHDSNARNDQRIMKVRMEYGMQGYGIYFGIIEILRDQANYTLAFNDLESISFDLRVDIKILEDIVLNYSLFTTEDDIFYSASLKRRMEALDKRRLKLSEAGRKGGLSKAKAKIKRPLSIKEDKSKVNNIKINIPFKDFWNLYDYKVGNKIKTQKNWESLKDEERLAIIKHLPLYVNSTPDKQFRKHPLTYLNNRGWEDEIVSLSNGVKKSHNFEMPDGKNYLAFCDKCLKSDFYEAYEFNPDNIESKCCNSKIIDKFEKNKRKQAMLNN